MKAFVREDKLVFKTDFPIPATPKAGSEKILVRVRAASINPADYKLPKLLFGPVVGFDFAGVVEAVAAGSPTHGLKVGDEVYGSTMDSGAGSLAELALVDGTKIARKPQSLTFPEAASIPTVYLTGLQALKTSGGLQPGVKVIVIGASGGCGLSGVQLARCLGAGQVVGVCSARNREVVERQGAHRVVDYTTEKIEDLFGGLPDSEKFDVVYDAATASGRGEDYETASWRVLNATGRYVPINGDACAWLRLFLNCQPARKHMLAINANRADLETLSGFFAAKTLEPIIAQTLPFTAKGVEDGFKMLKGRRTVGKIVFDMSLE